MLATKPQPLPPPAPTDQTLAQQPKPALVEGVANLSGILARLKTPAAQPTPPPQAGPQPAEKKEAPSDFASILKSLQGYMPKPNQPQQHQATSQPPQIPQFPSMYLPQQTTPQPLQMFQGPNMYPNSGPETDLSAIMNSLTHRKTPPQPMPGFAPPMQTQGSNQGFYEDPARKRARESGDDGDQGGYKKGKMGGRKKTWNGEVFPGL